MSRGRLCPDALLVAGGALLVVTIACTARQPDPPYRPTATIKDIMDSMVDPSADALWESVGTIVSAEGTEERAPHTDEEWTNLRHRAIQISEGSNLLLMTGRLVAKPGEKAEKREVELPPEQIQVRIDADRQSWNALAHGLQDAATPILKAIDAKDARGLFTAGAELDNACENCHLKYWYPSDKGAQAPKTP